MKYDFRKVPCVRIKLDNIQPGEQHPCYFCGIPIDVSNIEDCPTCGLIPCPACGKCFCGISELEQETLIKIHEKYCCDYDKLIHFEKIEIDGDENIIKNSNAALRYCAEKFRQGNAYPFLENLSTGNVVNQYFGHDISEWMRYAVFGLGNIPKKAKRILDIGSGFLDGPKIYLENRPDIGELYIVDPNIEFTISPRIKIIHDDMRNLRQYFKRKSLDFVSCFETIEHVDKEDGINVINVIYDILRPDGVLVLSTPNKAGFHSGTRQGIHLHEWEYVEMLNELEKKFKSIRTYGNRLKWENIPRMLTGEEWKVFSSWGRLLPRGILINLFSINHPAESYISVFVCKKK